MDTPCTLAAKCSDDMIGAVTLGPIIVPLHDHLPGHTEFDAHAEDWFRDPGSGKKTPDGRRRRRAIERCWNECPSRARLICLDNALAQGPDQQHGIWGGYTEEQRVEILSEVARRERVRRDAAVAKGEEHSDECIEVAQLADMTPDEIHGFGGVPTCRVNHQPETVAASA